MTTVSPERVIDSSAYVQGALTASKRLALAKLAAKWRRVDPSDVRGSIEPLLPEIAELMHEQQALGRQIAWTQGELSAAVATGQQPGAVTLPLQASRDGRLRNGPPFGQALSRAIPGALARIKGGIQPSAAVADAGRIVALQVGSIAHDEARLVTQDLVLNQGGGAVPRMGYARKPEGAHTCDFCRTLATRGPVYSADTAGFRAHRFCDCTTYAVPMESFDVDPGDWAAYQRWASSKARKAVQATAAQTPHEPVDRLVLVNAQIASYEPIVKAGNGTDWMRNKLDELYDERRSLVRGQAPPSRLREIPKNDITGGYWESEPGLTSLLGDQGYNYDWREKWAGSHFYVWDDEHGVGISFAITETPGREALDQMDDLIADLVDDVKPDFGFWRPPDVSVFDFQEGTHLGAGVMAATNNSRNLMLINRRMWDLMDPAKAAEWQRKQAFGINWNVAAFGAPEDFARNTLLHEFGHQVHYPSLDLDFTARSQALYDKWRYFGADDRAAEAVGKLAAGPSALNVLDQFNLILGVEGGPTLYARTDEGEMFAEAYAMWKSRDRLPGMKPSTREWIEDYAKEFGWS